MRGHLRKRGDRSWAVEIDLDRGPRTYLRHTHASVLLKQAVHLNEVWEPPDHANIGTTSDIYTQGCAPKWRNGRRGGLKNRWGLHPVPVRLRPSAPLSITEQMSYLRSPFTA